MTTENCLVVLRRAKLRSRHELAHVWLIFSLLVVFAAATATAQTTTVQFAYNVTAPGGGIVLTGSGINPATGQHYRHFWGGDEIFGLCRYDPDLDSPGPYTLNRNTCINFVGSVQFKPGALTLDGTTNTIYAPNITATAGQVYRMHFHPDSDGGHGIVDPLNIEVLLSGGGGGGGKKGNTIGCSTSLVAPAWASIGPDGNLYVASLRSGAVVRVLSPLTNPLPCTNVQNDVINSPDGRKNFGLGWVGHDLYGGDGFSAWVLHNADQCFTANNNFQACTALNILAGQVPVPVAMVGDQQYPNLDGKNLYYTNGAVVDKVTVTPEGTVVNTSYAVNFNLATGLALDTFNPAAEVLFVGDDPSAGNLPDSGHWWEVLPTPPPLQIPGAPVNVTATTGNAQATVSWQPAGDGQPISSYTVHNSSASNGTLVPDVTVGPDPGTTIVPTSAVVTGLTNGVTYQFEVAATNSAGTSAYSAPSNSVTPFAPTVPATPTNVSAVAGDSSAQVAWTGSSYDGGSPITGYTVTALAGGTPTSITANACATCTGVNVGGLSNGTTYTFTVHATNAVGNSSESAQSNAVTPSLTAIPPDISVTNAGPSSVNSGANATYTIKVNNSTTTTVPPVSLSDTWATSGATFISVSPSQGTCSSATGTISCNLGAIAGSGSATVTLVLQLTAQTTNTASGSMKDAAGNPLSDPTPADDTAAATTSISAPSTTTDIQVTGSAQNGGPAVGTADTYTWQIKNNQKTTANAVVFTDNLPPSLQFASASTSAGTCSTPAPGAAGGTVTCNLSALNGGDTMTVTINVVVTQAGSIANTGVASFTGTDTNPANNSFTVTINPK
ncbi:MAG TPA: fibronectin type III domain-containing protein [Candidatus Angelobacter sp.]|nr:fibronectin type III domain-containing protein [Candidatus Angelobacter sp.]